MDWTTALIAAGTINPGLLGYWIGGFILPMLFSSILLFFAGRKTESPSAGDTLRWLALIASLLFAYLGYKGGGALNLGGIAAVAVTAAWAYRQRLRMSK